MSDLDLLPALRGLERQRLAMIGKARFQQALRGVGGLAALVFVWKTTPHPLSLVVFIVALTLATLVAVVQVQIKVMKDVIAAYKEQVMPRLVESLGGTLTYHKDRAISRERFMASGLFFHRPVEYRGEDLITGTIGETRLRIGEIHAKGQDPLRAPELFTIFEGLFFELDFNKSLQGSVFLFPETADDLRGQPTVRLIREMFNQPGTLIKLEDPDFERHFVVYGSDPIESRYVLTPAMMRRIVTFREKAGVPVAMSFIGGKLYIAVYHEGDYLEPDVFKSFIDRTEITRFLDELRLAVGIVEDLNLNLRLSKGPR